MNKYHNVKTEIDGLKFDSKAEAKYYGVLKMRKLAGEIDSFDCQVRFDLIVNGFNSGFYKADFVTYKNGERLEVIDVKGVATQVFRLKKKLMKACHNVEIKEVK